MLFNSFDFAIFFQVVFLLYWLLFNRNNYSRNIFLIAASYLFYGWWDWRFLFLIATSSLLDFYFGRKIDEQEEPRSRKAWMLCSVVLNLGILFFFKYCNFFVESFVEAFSLFGMPFTTLTLNVILPVGISFYTFQSLSYTLDIYFRRIKPESSIVTFYAFLSFFPQLVAGPIERAKDLLPQFNETKVINYDMIRSGLLLMAWGLFKKIVIADRLGRYVDSAYGDISNVKGFPALVAVVFFAFQLYLDFSAYSDIAIGSARTLGFKLSVNFNRPYFSSSFGDFWKRWHISLSSWFRDYVYVPLGGNKRGKKRMLINIALVFLLSGLWHGASFNFILWGLVNAFFLIAIDPVIPGSLRGGKRFIVNIFVVGMWSLSLILFRAAALTDAVTLFGNLFKSGDRSLYSYGLVSSELEFVMCMLAFLILFEFIQERNKVGYSWFIERPLLFRWLVYFTMVLSILLLGSYGIGLSDSSFIYFQF